MISQNQNQIGSAGESRFDQPPVQQNLFQTCLRGYSQDEVRAFLEYHRERPFIYKEFKRFAYEMLFQGRERYSAKTIMERIRWEVDLKNTREDFKINNTFTAMYARVLMARHPEFSKFFELREVKGISI